MAKRQNIFNTVGVGFLITICIVGTVLVINRTNNKDLFQATEKLPTPIIFYLDNSIIHFMCLETSRCFGDVDLGNEIKEANNLVEHPLSLISAYHGRDSKLYLHLSGSIWNYLVRVDLITNQVQTLDLNDPSLFDSAFPHFLPGIGRLIHGKVVIATTTGKIGIVHDDFSLKVIDLKAPVFDFIQASDSKIAVVSADSRLLKGKKQVKIFLIDVDSSEFEEKTFDGPRADDSILITTDEDIKNLYWVSSNMSLSENVLHVLDIQSQKEILSASISNVDALAYTTLTSPRYQYQGMWYYNRRCCLEGPAPAIMMDMSTLKPVIYPGELLKNEADGTFIVSPFGDNFLIGTNSRVLVISPNGTTLKTYPLPEEWIGRDYSLLEYRK